MVYDVKSQQEIELQVKRIMGKWCDEPVFSNNKCIEAIYLFFWRWYYKCTSSLYYKCKYAWQRLFREYDDLDKWNAAWYIARKAVPVLTAMRNSFQGTSLKLHREDRFGVIELLTTDEVYAGSKQPDYKGPAAFTENEWCAILDDIIFAFQWQTDSDNFDKPMSDKALKQGDARQKRGLQLFSIYYKSLWD
jgi:hypothetical protein